MARCNTIAMLVAAEHFGVDNPRWEVTTRIPEDTPVHLVDQLEAEVRESNIEDPHYLLVYGPASAEDSDWTEDERR